MVHDPKNPLNEFIQYFKRESQLFYQSKKLMGEMK